MKRYI